MRVLVFLISQTGVLVVQDLLFTGVPLIFTRVPFVFTRVQFVFTRVPFVFTCVHSCSDSWGVLDQIFRIWTKGLARMANLA